MQNHRPHILIVVLLVTLLFNGGCGKKAGDSAAAVAPGHHEHKSPHGGTPVVLGDEAYHLELVVDAASGTLQVYVLDGEMENFVRVSAPSIAIDALVNDAPQALQLRAVADPATGETIGDTALFETQADWLKTAKDFDGTLKTITIHGTTFANVKFNFPKGNDKD